MTVRRQDITFFDEDDVTPLLGTVDGSGNIIEPSFSTHGTPAAPPPGPTVYYSDSFNRADNANLGTPDVGPAWEESANYRLTGNRATIISGAVNEDAYGQSGVADCLVTVTLATFVAESGMSVRADSVAGSNRIIWIPLTTTSMLLRKYVGGVQTNLGVITVPTMGNGTVIAMRMVGTTVEALVHGVVEASVTVPELTANTKHGIIRVSGTSNGAWDDFSVVDP